MPIASLREQIQTERMFASPLAEAVEHQRDAGIGEKRQEADHAHHLRLRQRAGIGVPGRAEPSTHSPSTPRLAPFSSAARARQASAMPATPRLIA